MIYINNYPLAEDCLLYLPPKDFFLVQSNVHVLLLYIFAVFELCRLLCRNIHIL